MKQNVLLLILLLFCNLSWAQEAEIIKYDRLENIIHQQNDKITVINFWATWCGPCIKELPYFESLNSASNNDVDVHLISVDFASKIKLVNNFIKKKDLKSRVYLLDEIDYNSWIDRVDSSWSGAIPATLIINTTTSKRTFIEGELQKGDLEKHIKAIIN